MSKPYFALNLDVVGKPCLVIGGDAEALEKSARLVEARAELTVVAKRASPELAAFLERSGAKLLLRPAEPADLDGKFLVLNCVKTDPPLSAWVHAEGLKRHAIVSAYDQPEAGNAVMMGLVRAGRLRLSVASNGSSPGLVAAVRRALEGLFDADFARYSESVAEQRECHIAAGATPKQRKARFAAQLKDFSIEGRIVYPAAYRRNVEQGVERGADGLWRRKGKAGPEKGGTKGKA